MLGGLFGCTNVPQDEPTETPPIVDDTPYDPSAPVEPLTYLDATPATEPEFPRDGVYIAYSVNETSAGSIMGSETVQEVTNGGTTDMVRAVANLGYRFVAWSDGQTNPARRGDTAS